jgi:heme-degrading monooxygenase HmoA
MIVRLWRGRASADKADAYEAHVTTAVFPKLVKIEGYLHGRLLRRHVGAQIEFLVLTEWKSWEAIRAFAGDDPDVAVMEPAARAVLAAFDERVQHFEVSHESPAGDK